MDVMEEEVQKCNNSEGKGQKLGQKCACVFYHINYNEVLNSHTVSERSTLCLTLAVFDLKIR